MRWSSEAKEAVSRAPFFVRKRVTKRVEEEAMRCGADEVRIEHVRTSRKKFLDNMEDEVKGYCIETCFGSSGCPNHIIIDGGMANRLDRMLLASNLKGFLRERVAGPLKIHHEFRVSISDCPNACSRPQIVDVGLIGACQPLICEEGCDRCGSCVNACKESAVQMSNDREAPRINQSKCLFCGACVAACPAETIKVLRNGYRIILGGKLGRHPQLGKELRGIHSSGQTIEIIDRCLKHYLRHNKAGERFGEVLNRVELTDLPIGDCDSPKCI